VADDEKKGSKALTNIGTGAAFGAMAAAARGQNVAGGAVFGALVPMFQGVKDILAAHVDKQQAKWWQAYGAASGATTAEEIAAEVRQKFENDPGARKVILNHMRALMDDPDEAVIPALGTLGQMYVRQSRPIDAFFRGMTRLLLDLSAAEYDCLKALVKLLLSQPSDIEPMKVQFAVKDQKRILRIIQTGVHTPQDEPSEERAWNTQYDEITHRLFQLLRDHHIALEEVVGRSSADAIVIEAHVLQRIADVLV
jgi:hypothetical protein